YIPDLGGFLNRPLAKQLFATRSFRQFACRDTDCCRGGAETMMSEARRHFAYSRMGEIAELSKAPATLRPNLYLERFLPPATDQVGRVLAYTELPRDLRAALERSSTRQAGWRATLGEMSHGGLAS